MRIVGAMRPRYDQKARNKPCTDDIYRATLHAYLSKTPGDMTEFVAADQAELDTTERPAKDWANIQMEFIPGPNDSLAVAYSLYTDRKVWSQVHNTTMQGYTHRVFRLATQPHSGRTPSKADDTLPYPFPAPQTVVWDGAAMVRARNRYLAGKGNATVLRQLTATADAQMKLPAVVAGISVTDKPVLPPSGDSHDYYSIAAYLWPCTAKCNVRSPAQ